MKKMNLVTAFAVVNILSTTAFAQDSSSDDDGGVDATASSAVETGVSTDTPSSAPSVGSRETADTAVSTLGDFSGNELDAAVPVPGDAGGHDSDGPDSDAAAPDAGNADAGDVEAVDSGTTNASPDTSSGPMSEPKPPKVRSYELLKNESRACSIAAVGQRSGYWSTLALASLGWTFAGRRRARSVS